MQDSSGSSTPSLLPLIHYRDPEKSADWLCKAFGFERETPPSAGDGGDPTLLRFADSLLMLSRREDEVSDPSPGDPSDEAAGAAALSCYCVVPDIEGHFRRAKEAGAEIVQEIGIYELGGCRYACRDPDGQLWSFGTYDPRREQAAAVAAPRRAAELTTWDARRWALAAGLAGAVLATAVTSGIYGSTRSQDTAIAEVAAPSARIEAEVAARASAAHAALKAAEDAASKLRDELSRERHARTMAERSASELGEKLADLHRARDAAEQKSHELETEVRRLQAESATLRPQPVPPPAAKPPDALTHVEEATPAGEGPTARLAEGQRLMAKGDVAAARRLFESLAEKGMAEGALALGSTYDPVSLAQAGLTSTPAEPENAKRWYRRAHELAQSEAHKKRPPVHE